MNHMCQDKMYKTKLDHTIGIFGFQTGIYNIYFICLNARGITLLVYTVVDGFDPAVCHVFASCFDRLAGFYLAIKSLQRPRTNNM